MWYEYRCRDCGRVVEDQRCFQIGSYLPDKICVCRGSLQRVVSMPQVAPVQEPYFNHTVGQVVTSNRDFEEKLRIGALKQSERVGMEHNYVPVYPSEGKSYIESTASNDGQGGASLERDAKPSTTKKIFT